MVVAFLAKVEAVEVEIEPRGQELKLGLITDLGIDEERGGKLELERVFGRRERWTILRTWKSSSASLPVHLHPN